MVGRGRTIAAAASQQWTTAELAREYGVSDREIAKDKASLHPRGIALAAAWDRAHPAGEQVPVWKYWLGTWLMNLSHLLFTAGHRLLLIQPYAAVENRWKR